MKEFLKQLLPRGLITRVNYLRPSHRRWLAESKARELEIQRLKIEHDARNREATEDEIILHDQRLKAHPASRVAFEYFSYRSPAMVREMTVFLRHTAGCGRLLDVGALHGIFSLLFVQASGARSAVAVDASPVAFGRLAHNVAANGLAGKIATREIALSDGDGVLSMHYDWEHAVAGSGNAAPGEMLSVPMTTGDSLCSSLSFEPDVVKIDVEGHETKVLRGLRAVITAHRPLLFLEVHPQLIAEAGDAGGDVIEYLADLGYSAVTIQGQKIQLSRLFFHDDRFLLMPETKPASPRL